MEGANRVFVDIEGLSMMQLSAEVFKGIIRHLKSAAGPSDRRHGPRVGLHNQVDLTFLGHGDGAAAQTFKVGVKDLSPGGICLLVHAPLAEETMFAICLPAFGAPGLTAIYKVRSCQALEKNLFRIGAILIKISDPAPAQSPEAKPANTAPPAPQAA